MQTFKVPDGTNALFGGPLAVYSFGIEKSGPIRAVIAEFTGNVVVSADMLLLAAHPSLWACRVMVPLTDTLPPCAGWAAVPRHHQHG